jgi:pyruvate dehydrogenase E2 component (dihydrolipoyllysine-residue acetyltransferase)
MVTPIVMPKFGQMTEESTIVEWLKKEGEKVAKGETLFAVETDKSVMEVESFKDGTLLKIVVGVGVSVPVQSVVGYLGEIGEVIPETPVPERRAPVSAAPVPTAAALSPRGGTPAAIVAAPPAPAVFRVSPRAEALARECVVDPHPIQGSGPEGRVVERDVKAYLDEKDYWSLRVSPAAKALAAKEGLDLLAVRAASGSKRIEVADIERAVAEKPAPMTKMRQVIAQRLTQSVVTAPHFYVTVEADMTNALAHRTRLDGGGARYTITDFIAQASILALKEFPTVNSATDGRNIRWSSRVHLGIVVNLDQGLVVPVVRDADQMTMAELSERSKTLIERARAGGLAPDEMSGSTFTISNMGMLDVENFTAIINPGESAILAVSSTIMKPVVRGDEIVARPMLKMTLSSDHRLIDGATAARFINSIKAKLEDNGLWNTLTSS